MEFSESFIYEKWSSIYPLLRSPELELDGIKTHITMRKELCPFYESAFDIKVRTALSAIRSARDLFRIVIGSKQWTLTTRSKSANRHGLWHMQVIRNWNCPACHIAEGDPDNYGYYDHIGLGTDNCVYSVSELEEMGLLELHLKLLEAKDTEFETAEVVRVNPLVRSEIVEDHKRQLTHYRYS